VQARINIITLGTHDIAKATKFYQEGLELPKMDFASGEISFFALNGTWLSLYPWELLATDAQIDPMGSGFRGVTLAHNVESENRVIELLQRAERAGAKIVKSARQAEWGGFSGYFADLDGHLWEIAYNPFFWPGPKNEFGTR
jgi:catechol 2,3-dioxygenase-like lactoylglutathione lyase family enzyme